LDAQESLSKTEYVLISGEYGVHVKFNDEHVPESPAMVHVLPISRDAKKIVIVGLRDRGLEVSKLPSVCCDVHKLILYNT